MVRKVQKTNKSKSESKNKIVVILGPTSSGKTKLAVELANAFNGEIVSADSRQVYIGMDIGTGKDLNEYGKTPYHLIDVTKPKSQFSLAQYQKLAYKAINNIIKRHKVPFLVGGSGLYLQSIIDGYQLSKVKPDIKFRQKLNKKTLFELQSLVKKNKIELNQSDFSNKRRIIRAIEVNQNLEKFKPTKNSKYNCLILGLTFPKNILDKRIDKRLNDRLKKQGLIAEVKRLRLKGLSWERLDSFGLEYRFVSKYLRKELTYDEMVNQLAVAIHQFSKRQMTWFKKDSRIKWIKNFSQAQKLIADFIEN